MVSEEKNFKCFFFFFFFFLFFHILVSVATSENEQWVHNHVYDTRLLKEYFWKVLSKYLQFFGSKCHFLIFPIIRVGRNTHRN